MSQEKKIKRESAPGADWWVENAVPCYVPFRGFVLKYRGFEISLDRRGCVNVVSPSGEIMIYKSTELIRLKLRVKLNEIILQEIAAGRKTY